MVELTKIMGRLQDEIEKTNLKIEDTKIRIRELELKISSNVYSDTQVEAFVDKLESDKKKLKEYEAIQKGFTKIVEGY